jgi:hypothetical protein
LHEVYVVGTYTGFQQLQVVLLPEGASIDSNFEPVDIFMYSGKCSGTSEMKPNTGLAKMLVSSRPSSEPFCYVYEFEASCSCPYILGRVAALPSRGPRVGVIWILATARALTLLG